MSKKHRVDQEEEDDGRKRAKTVIQDDFIDKIRIDMLYRAGLILDRLKKRNRRIGETIDDAIGLFTAIVALAPAPESGKRTFPWYRAAITNLADAISSGVHDRSSEDMQTSIETVLALTTHDRRDVVAYYHALEACHACPGDVIATEVAQGGTVNHIKSVRSTILQYVNRQLGAGKRTASTSMYASAANASRTMAELGQNGFLDAIISDTRSAAGNAVFSKMAGSRLGAVMSYLASPLPLHPSRLGDSSEFSVLARVRNVIKASHPE